MNVSRHRDLYGIAAAIALIFIAPQTVLGGTDNTARGTDALKANTGSQNSAFGFGTLSEGNIGSCNTAGGRYALSSNIDGHHNTGIGEFALGGNNSGAWNTAIGDGALSSGATGGNNTAAGDDALGCNLTGSQNTAAGYQALRSLTGGDGHGIGDQNTAFGSQALYVNVSGWGNAASGDSALYNNDSGWGNTAHGYQALYNMVSGHNNVAIGNTAGYYLTGSNNIDIGDQGNASDNNTMRLGNGSTNRVFIAGISGKTVSGGAAVYINSAGQLGTTTSSERFKQDIYTIDASSDRLLQLRPVSFIYKEDDKKELQYGLIAEEVAKVYPELVQYDQEGKPFTVYYHLLTPLLLSELQKSHAVDDAQQLTLTVRQAKLDAQQTELASLNQQLHEQRAAMLALMEQEQQQHATAMVALQQKLNKLDQLVQASGSSPPPSRRVALAPSH